jgi:hypothetical protein
VGLVGYGLRTRQFRGPATPEASVPLILRTLVADGRLQEGSISASTVRRFFQQRGVDRMSLRAGGGGKMRLRWQADKPMALWHGDVCHGSPLGTGDRSVPVRIHALLDDAPASCRCSRR